MSRFRPVLFWLHLGSGLFAGIVVFTMSITGVALTYEKQMIEWADRQLLPVVAGGSALPLLPEQLLAGVREAHPEALPTQLTLQADPAAPATVTLAATGPVLVDPRTAVVVGAPPSGLRDFFRTMRNWHRWLALEGASRPLGKAVTGAANLMFLFLVASGLYLWMPGLWTRVRLRNVLWFRRNLSPKARDFNWHHVVGFWAAIPLALVVVGAVPISYTWAGNFVYRVAGTTPPLQAGPPPGRPDEVSQPVLQDGLDQHFRLARDQVSGWRTMNIRLPRAASQPFVFTIDQGYGGQPQKRGTLTVDQASSVVAKWETFADLDAGRRLRAWFRFVHTGEYYGLPGQTTAGIVSAGTVVLVWTGFALAWRRFQAWLRRRASARRAPLESAGA